MGVLTMAQQKRQIGLERDYPGSYGWPIYEVMCPECNEWKSEYGNMDQLQHNGEWYTVCVECEEKINDEERKAAVV
jgi:hypothetical protein